ncbi:MAG: crotonase/enoyl-CoA hydratase family protein [Deltaproteobacteria bacterium]|nr:crotonase/enoyl-CoA hydratase family protein [Deltaproteobacteria bacterium]MBW2218230.1 crotonase/enoyl-CoA hydratase family protein [Deltaproteobacteria bacterium]
MSYQNISFSVDHGIAVLRLDMPETRNAITGAEAIAEIEDVCLKVNKNLDIKVLIITGTDPAFSSGGNIKDMKAKKGMFRGTPAGIMESYRRNVQRIPLAVHGVEVPAIAAVNGPAIGAGCDLALMCDIRVASESAKFGETFLNVGLIPGDGGAYFLPRAVGMAKACELTFTGDVIDAGEALRIGLVNYVTPHDNLMNKSMELAGKIASKPSEALRMSKRLIHMGQYATLPQLLEQSAAYQALCHHTEDHMEALDAFFQKRKPVYKGR